MTPRQKKGDYLIMYKYSITIATNQGDALPSFILETDIGDLQETNDLRLIDIFEKERLTLANRVLDETGELRMVHIQCIEAPLDKETDYIHYQK